ncbi:tetratricopeptide repeat protein, partial [Methylobacterium nigriterrae]|uniref:tetratricopeptide repeat protein n=1 Tax=Methylobacterium nigriterrae TaxID=3127512 RepID=UPI003013D6C5
LTPAFARGSALSELASRLSAANLDLARKGLADRDPLVRIGALDMLEGAPASRIWPLVSPLLSDAVRGVRLRAVMLAAAVPSASQPPAERAQFDRAAAEFIASQTRNADRPEARSALGTFQARRGRTAEAEAEYKASLRLSPQYAGAAINLADLYRSLGREPDGEGVLRQALAASPREAGLHHALGLTLIRLKRHAEALDDLRRAAELAPDQARYAYVYAVGLHASGQASAAIAVLKDTLTRHPTDRATLSALIGFSRDAGDLASALEYAERLAQLAPGDPRPRVLVESLRRQIGAPEAR